MNAHAVVRRTSKGESEIQDRAHGLDRHLRFVLILVDGSSTVSEIVAKGAGRPGITENLARLAEEGYVVIDVPSAGVHEEREVAAQAKAELIAIARELLGRDAENVVSRIAAAPETNEALREVVGQCSTMVRLIIDEAKGDRLAVRCAAILDDL